MYVYAYIYIHVCMYVCIYMYVCMYIYIYISPDAFPHLYCVQWYMLCDARTHARMSTHTYTHTHALFSLSLSHARTHTRTVVDTPVVITVQRQQADGTVCDVGNKRQKQMLIAHALHRDTCTSSTSFTPYTVTHTARESERL
jgi:hypothetical protein